ncbi:MAG TPA: HYR domain-containing protein, partial [Saprospiraceae bacterium]|nr:HYR domain-containing protein [Saprospiraceae bacterium]
VVVQRAQYSDIEYPADAQVDCFAPDLSPALLGEPKFKYNGKLFSVSGAAGCAYGVSFKDSTLAGCGGSRHILREWLIIGWCQATTVRHTQTIEVTDLTPPKVTCPPKPVLSTTAAQCVGPVNLPDVVITDDCSRASAIRVYWTVKGKQDSLEGKLENFAANSPTLIDTLGVLAVDSFFPVGLTELRYVATDACGNKGSCTTVLEVWDQTPPAAKCDSTTLSVTLGNEGSGTLAATLLDGGSADLCSAVGFKAKRQKTSPCFSTGNYEDELIFCCDDIGDTVLVTLRVFDVALPAGGVAATFAAGHFSECTARVLVGDILPPRCVGPPDVTVSCRDFNPDLNTYGDVDSRTCRVHSITQSIDSSQFNSSCRVGQLTRYFRTFDVSGMPGSSCSQRIKVEYEQSYFVRFPDDLIVTACSNGASWGEPTFFGVDCERMSATFTDEVFYVVPDACYKVDRTWRVFNTCTNNPNQPLTVVPNPTPHATLNHPTNLIGPVVSASGTPAPWAASVVAVMPGAPLFDYSTLWSLTTNGYTYKQIIKVVDLEKPTTISCPQGGVSSGDLTNNDPNLWNESYWVDQGSNDMREAPIKLNLVARDACAGSDVSIRYLLFLDLENNGVRETVISSATPPTAGTVLYNNAQNPNYGGGSSRVFDERNVPTSSKYRFALQTTVQNNTKVAQVMWNSQDMPLNYVLPQLPYGQHRIQWTVEDKCGSTSTCEYNFTLAAGPLPSMTCDTSF